MADREESDIPASAPPISDSAHVFISYATRDVNVADAVVGELERVGLACWIAPRDVVPGALYADEIVGAIDDAQVSYSCCRNRRSLRHMSARKLSGPLRSADGLLCYARIQLR